MYAINFVKLGFSFITLGSLVFGSLYNLFEKHLPEFVIQFVRYGKLDNKKRKRTNLEVPKSWFKHFYLASAIVSIVAFILGVYVYINGQKTPNWLIFYLDHTVGSLRTGTVAPANVFLALTLLLLQCVRRFYETHFLSIFSKNGKMNVSYYIIGYAHYFGVFTAVLGEAPGLNSSTNERYSLKWSDIGYKNVICTLIFIWAWYHQYISNVILANLRKNKKGEVVTEEHKIPKGDLFDYVTSPHLFTEKIMYICLTIILWGNSTFLFVLAWVLANQTETALLSYWWYKNKFSNFPKNRKSLIPFIF